MLQSSSSVIVHASIPLPSRPSSYSREWIQQAFFSDLDRTTRPFTQPHANRSRLSGPPFLERIPKAKRLVSCSGDDRLSVRTHGEVEDSVGVTAERGDLGHSWVSPDADLIGDGSSGIPMGGDEFVGILGPHEVADLIQSKI